MMTSKNRPRPFFSDGESPNCQILPFRPVPAPLPSRCPSSLSVFPTAFLYREKKVQSEKVVLCFCFRIAGKKATSMLANVPGRFFVDSNVTTAWAPLVSLGVYTLVFVPVCVLFWLRYRALN